MSDPTIILLDDDPFILDVLRDVLKDLGEILSGSLWTDVSNLILKAAREGKTIVLVCDMRMPGMDGLSFCKIVRRYAPNAQIIAFSGAIDEYEAGALEEVVDAKVHKDAGAMGLRMVVEGLLATSA